MINGIWNFVNDITKLSHSHSDFWIEIVSISYLTVSPTLPPSPPPLPTPLQKGCPNRFWRRGGGVWHDPSIPPYCAALPYTHTQSLGNYCKGIFMAYIAKTLKVGSWDHMPKFLMIVWWLSERCLLAV